MTYSFKAVLYPWIDYDNRLCSKVDMIVYLIQDYYYRGLYFILAYIYKPLS